LRGDRTQKPECRQPRAPSLPLLPEIDCPFIAEPEVSVCHPSTIVRLTIAHLIVSFYPDFDRTVTSLWRSGLWIVRQAVLGAKLPVNAFEYRVQLRILVGIVHGSAGAVGYGFKGVFAGCISPV